MMAISAPLRTVLRRLRRHAGFAAVAVGSVALAVAGATLLASLASQVLLRELPVPQPSALVRIALQSLAEDGRMGGDGTFSLEETAELAASVRNRLTLAGYAAGSAVIASGAGAERVAVEWVTPSYFEALGLPPAVGRLFDARDTRGAGVAVLSNRAFRERFASSPAAVGEKILADGLPVTVVGVMPESFRSVEVGDAPDFFLLATAAPESSAYFRVFGRLQEGATAVEIEGTLRSTFAAIRARHPEFQRFIIFGNETLTARERLDVLPGARGRSSLRGTFASTLGIVGAMLVVFLLVLSANLANLLAARAVEERATMGLQLALGASRLRIALEWIAESAAIALVGTAVGLLAAAAAAPLLLRSLPVAGLDRALAWSFDWTVVAVSAAVALPIAMAVGGLAAWEAAHASPGSTLSGRGATAGRTKVRWRWTLVAAQVALSMVLLVGMGLLVRTLSALLAIDTGLPLGQVLSFRVDLPTVEPLQSDRSFRALREDLATLPGVEHVGYGSNPALAAVRGFSMLSIQGYRPTGDESLMIPTVPVSPGLVEALGLPVLRGRSFAPSDAQGPARAILVNQLFVDRYLAGVDPIGHRVAFGVRYEDWSSGQAAVLEIVGVIADGRLSHVQEQPAPRVFPLVPTAVRAVSFFLRTSGDPIRLAPLVRTLLRERHPDAALGTPITLARQRDLLLADEHFLGRLSFAFGASALALAALGLYGVLSYAMRARQREIALRMALGAPTGSVLRLVASTAARAVLAGAAVGIAIAVPASHWLEAFLFGVEPHDPVSFATALLVLLAVATAAWWLPARRSIRLDPAQLLRAE